MNTVCTTANNPRVAALMQVEKVSKHYRYGETSVKALDGVCLTVWPGDFLVITGRSGAGKSTLLSLMGGLTKPTAGSIRWRGRALSGLGDRDLSALRAEEIGFIFQFPSLIPTLTAFENVVLPTLFNADTPPPIAHGAELLRRVGLEDKLSNYPSQLSGGQQRRVAVARAFMNRPVLLLADEPTGDLDVDTEQEIMALLHDLNREGLTIVLVTHNPALAQYGCRALRMDQGRLREQAAEQVVSPPCGTVRC